MNKEVVGECGINDNAFFHKRIEDTNNAQPIIECHDETVSFPNSFALSK